MDLWFVKYVMTCCMNQEFHDFQVFVHNLKLDHLNDLMSLLIFWISFIVLTSLAKIIGNHVNTLMPKFP
jgi:hypothetical protein